jgi:hypothetical protein
MLHNCPCLALVLAPALAAPGPQESYNFFLSAFDRAQTGTPAQLGGILGNIAATQVGLEGVLLTATVEIARWDADASEPSSVYFEQISGSITVDGRFDCTRAIDGTYQGDPVQIVHRTTYDGRNLRDHAARGETGNVYRMDKDTDPRVADLYAGSIAYLHAWVYDPYAIPLYPTAPALEEDITAEGLAIVQRVSQRKGGGTYVAMEYEFALRGTGALPTRKVVFPYGRSVREEHLFSNFTELRTDDWRPSKIVYTRFVDGEPGGRRITVTTTISQATPLSADQAKAVPQAFDEGLGWHVWK